MGNRRYSRMRCPLHMSYAVLEQDVQAIPDFFHRLGNIAWNDLVPLRPAGMFDRGHCVFKWGSLVVLGRSLLQTKRQRSRDLMMMCCCLSFALAL